VFSADTHVTKRPCFDQRGACSYCSSIRRVFPDAATIDDNHPVLSRRKKKPTNWYNHHARCLYHNLAILSPGNCYLPTRQFTPTIWLPNPMSQQFGLCFRLAGRGCQVNHEYSYNSLLWLHTDAFIIRKWPTGLLISSNCS